MDISTLSQEENQRNSEILTYLKDKKYVPSFDDIAREVGYKKGYVSKLANIGTQQKISILFTLSLELLYKIPRNIFFNPNILSIDDVESNIQSFQEQTPPIGSKEKKEYTLNYNYIYTYLNNQIDKYKIHHHNDLFQLTHLGIYSELTNDGYIFDKFQAEIIFMVNSAIRGITTMGILERCDMLNDIAPASMIGKELYGDQKRMLYIALISKKEIKDKDIITLLKDNDNVKNENMKLIISKRIQDYLES